MWDIFLKPKTKWTSTHNKEQRVTKTGMLLACDEILTGTIWLGKQKVVGREGSRTDQKQFIKPDLCIGQEIIKRSPPYVKHRITSPASSTPRYISKRNEDRCKNKDLCVNVQNSYSQTTKRLKHCSCPSADEWLSKLWSIYTIEYLSSHKKEMNYWRMLHHGWTLKTLC